MGRPVLNNRLPPRGPAASPSDALGHVLGVDGSQARVRLHSGGDARTTVGKFLGIRTGQSVVFGVITSIAVREAGAGEAEDALAQVDLLGELKEEAGGASRFQRGVTEYPAIGDPIRPVRHDDLAKIYEVSGSDTITIGQLQQDGALNAYIKLDDMLTKHFAVLGTTGVGKSSGVALLLREILGARPDLRVFLVDPHNEYARCFADRAQVLNPRNLRLPFWLFNFEEIVDVFFRGRPGVEEEVGILSELIPLAKASFVESRSERPMLRRSDAKGAGFTIDTPVPYRLETLVGLINERMGKLENRASWMKYHRLIARIEAVRNDPRYAFMFDNANVGGDTMVEVVSQLFRLQPNGRPMTIMQLAGFPAEVVDSVVSVVCRMAFDFALWSDGAVPLLFACEEAHRYAPADRTIGFGPTRKAISRIAKEGRKYNVYLGLVTQRPAELDATIVSQCSTLFAMRMANDRDQDIVRAAVSDAAASLLAFVPSLGTREVFAFGEGVALPTRLRFGELPAHLLPKSEAVGTGRMDASGGVDETLIANVVERWRGAMMSSKLSPDDKKDDDLESLALGEFSSVGRAGALGPSTFAAVADSTAAPASAAPPKPAPAEAPRAAGPVPSFSADLQNLRARLRNR